MNAQQQIPNEKELFENLNKIAFTLDKAYLGHLENAKPFAYDEYFSKLQSIHDTDNIRVLRIDRWVYDANENIIDCFQNVLSAFSGSDTSLALVIHRTVSHVEMYFVTQNVGEGRNQDSQENIELLANSIQGNFPGTQINAVDSRKTGEIMDRLLNFYDGHNDGYKAIAALSNVPTEKTKDYLSQGIDKLLNGIIPNVDKNGKENDYTIVFLAKALDQDAVHAILSGYQELATALAPYAGYQFQVGENEATSNSEMRSLSHSKGISNSITKTHSVNISGFASTALSFVKNGTRGGPSVSYGYSVGRSKTTSTNDTSTFGTTRTISLGTSENTMYSYKSYVVSDFIKKLEATIDRIQKSQANGLWSSAAYVLAHSMKQGKNIANYLRSLSQGDESYIEPAYMQAWTYQGNGPDVTPFREVKKYLRNFVHPVFLYKDSEDNSTGNIIPVTPTTDVSTTELARLFAFPQKSVQGIPVIECAWFGREPSPMSKPKETVNLGCIYHMRTEECGKVLLDRPALTSHTFITGSTGAGKSNTIYTMLAKMCLQKSEKSSDLATHFLVIEPAKGEYKDALGGYPGVSVYGTNPYKTPILKLNPFSFPKDTHVLEHIDRLVEVFNACWPMYAAMPAVLKASVELAYENCGWDLASSKCFTGSRNFPTFRDVRTALPDVVNSKGFSKDTQGDYTGALLTRLESLTNGINGQVLCAKDELADRDLFDRNVIVDLSRVGSSETKALLMGILVLKLQEHRMAQRAAGTNRSNSGLQHITVLEEAHNLLRRTSTEQSQESSNLQGKSVEMLTNAIAEMRTYGEGFIIADQAPGLLDMAAIRNTNTKIILRLPDEGDRVLVGKAAGLNDDQIVELSRLDTGVAAVYQNHWLEPVLCKVEHFSDEKPFAYEYKPSNESNGPIHKYLMRLFALSDDKELSQEDVDVVSRWIASVDQPMQTKSLMHKSLKCGQLPEKDQEIVAYSLFKGRQLAKSLVKYMDEKEGVKHLDTWLLQMDGVQNEELAIHLRQLILRGVIESSGVESLNRFSTYITEGRVL